VTPVAMAKIYLVEETCLGTGERKVLCYASGTYNAQEALKRISVRKVVTVCVENDLKIPLDLPQPVAAIDESIERPTYVAKYVDPSVVEICRVSDDGGGWFFWPSTPKTLVVPVYRLSLRKVSMYDEKLWENKRCCAVFNQSKPVETC